MDLSRRLVLAAPLAALLPYAARASTVDPLGPRTLGNAGAKVQVIEYFSLTCTHCANFANETMPEVEKKLIDPGTVFYTFSDFPLDRVALVAAMVARSLPPERYAPFIFALFASQDRWAFAPKGGNSIDALQKMAVLAGMSEADFHQAVGNKKLEAFILKEQQEAEQKYHVDSTPTFIIGGKPHAGDVPYADFAKLIAAAGG